MHWEKEDEAVAVHNGENVVVLVTLTNCRRIVSHAGLQAGGKSSRFPVTKGFDALEFKARPSAGCPFVSPCIFLPDRLLT